MWTTCRVTQSSSQDFDGRINAMVEIDNCAARPESPPDFVAGDNLAAIRNQHPQDLKRLLSQQGLGVIPRTQFTRLEIQLKVSQTDSTCKGLLHTLLDGIDPESTTST